MVRTNNNGKSRSLQGLLTTSQAADYFNIHPNTLRSWTNKGLIRSYRLGSRGDRRFAIADLRSFLDDHRITPLSADQVTTLSS